MGPTRLVSWAAALGIAIAVAGCGSTSTPKTSSAAHSTAAPPASAPPASAPLSSSMALRVLHGGELAGMSASSPPTLERDVTIWVAANNLSPSADAAEVARLRRLGFVAGITENLVTAGNPNRYGLSLLEQFSSARSARGELVHQTGPSAPGGPAPHFAVPGIPGAVGFGGGTDSGGRNVAFAHGPYYYLVGAGWQGGASNAVSQARLIAVAKRLYARAQR